MHQTLLHMYPVLLPLLGRLLRNRGRALIPNVGTDRSELRIVLKQRSADMRIHRLRILADQKNEHIFEEIAVGSANTRIKYVVQRM